MKPPKEALVQAEVVPLGTEAPAASYHPGNTVDKLDPVNPVKLLFTGKVAERGPPVVTSIALVPEVRL